jgi:hypothetical protein
MIVNNACIATLERAMIDRHRIIKVKKDRVMSSFTEIQMNKFIKRFQCLEQATTLTEIKGITHDFAIQEAWLEHNLALSELKSIEYTMTILNPKSSYAK